MATNLRHLPVTVTNHAREQARERFPGFKSARIVDEVRAALTEGRMSSRKPRGLHPPDDPDTLYVWTPDSERVYALRPEITEFVVITTMKAELNAA